MSMFKLISDKLVDVLINDNVYTGRNINIGGSGNIRVNGKTVNQIQGYEVHVEILGDVQGKVETMSGDINITGSCGDVKTMSGDVEAGTIEGNCNTMSGDITGLKTRNGNKEPWEF